MNYSKDGICYQCHEPASGEGVELWYCCECNCQWLKEEEK